MNKFASALFLTLASSALFGFTGCATSAASRSTALVSGYQPDNIFKLARVLPSDLRRVLVLPVASQNQSENFLAGCEAVEPALVAELIRTKRFEVIQVTGQTLRSRTGRDHWMAADSLPADFLANLREVSGCDAILFAELTEYRSYAPVAIGWRLKLVDARTGFPLWASDELFDARRSEVVVAARHYRSTELRSLAETGGDWAVLHSPRRFAQYSVAQLFDTLPLR